MRATTKRSLLSVSITNDTVTVAVMKNGFVDQVDSIALSNGQHATEALRSIAAQHKIKQCCIIVPQNKVNSLAEPYYAQKSMPEEKVQLNVPFQFKNVINVSEISRYMFDYKVVREAPDEAGLPNLYEIVPIAVQRSEILQLQQIVTDAGLTPVSVLPFDEVYSYALRHALANIEHWEEKQYSFIHLADTSLHINIYKGSVLSFSYEEEVDSYTSKNQIYRTIINALAQYKNRGEEEFAHEIITFLSGQCYEDKELETILMEDIGGISVDSIVSLLEDVASEDVAREYPHMVGACLPVESIATKYKKPEYNLLIAMKKKRDMKKLLIPAIAIVVLVLFAYLGIFQVVQKVNGKQSALEQAKTDLKNMQAQLEKYDEVKAEYVLYYKAYEQAKEKLVLDKTSCFNLVEYYVFPYVTVTQMTIEGNTINIATQNASMKTLSNLINQLMELECVSNAYVTSSSSMEGTLDDKDDTIATSSTFVIELAPTEEIIRKGIGPNGQLNTTDQARDDQVQADTHIDNTSESYVSNRLLSGEAIEGRIVTDSELESGELTEYEVAWQVIRGKWQDTTARWNALNDAGYDAAKIQQLVDDIFSRYDLSLNGSPTSVDPAKIDAAEHAFYEDLKASMY